MLTEGQESPNSPRPQRRFVVPPKPGMSPTALTVGIMLILGLLAAGGIIIYSIVQKRQASIDSSWQADAEMHAKAQEPKAPPPKPAPPARPSPAAAPTEPSII